MRIVVAMSGGVDSSVAAGLLVRAGHDVIGMSMQLYDQAGSQTSDAGPSSSFSDRPWVKSAGAGVRVNAFGFAVIEMSAAHAFDRPRDKWQFLFALQPGF